MRVGQGGNPLGCIVWLLLAVVSFGLAIILWFLWGMERADFLPKVIVSAYPDDSGVSRITVTSAKKPEYAEPLAGWIKSELVEKRRAATADNRGPSGFVDPAEQIRRLAELRDSGTITEEEFEFSELRVCAILRTSP